MPHKTDSTQRTRVSPIAGAEACRRLAPLVLVVTLRIRLIFQWLPTAAVAVIAAYVALGAAAWCWDGAYNVLQGHSPAYGFSAMLFLAGALPAVAAGASWVRQRRAGESPRSSVAVGSAVAIAASVGVLVLRAIAAGGF